MIQRHPMMLIPVFSIGFYEVPHFTASQLRKCRWESKGCSCHSCSGLPSFLEKHWPAFSTSGVQNILIRSGLSMFKNARMSHRFLPVCPSWSVRHKWHLSTWQDTSDTYLSMYVWQDTYLTFKWSPLAGLGLGITYIPLVFLYHRYKNSNI